MTRSDHLVIRADASASMGIGHVMRCLSLARAWLETGGRATLVGDCPGEVLQQRVRDAGVRLERCEPGRTSTADARSFLSRHAGPDLGWLVVDGYQFDIDFLEACASTRRLLVIDDHAHLPSYPATFLLNQNIGAHGIVYPIAATTTLLLGPRYALLRPEFAERARDADRTTDRANRILVTIGGEDADNWTAVVLTSLGDLPGTFDVRVVLGPTNPHVPDIRRLTEGSDSAVDVIVGTSEMASLMDWCDVAVAAAGSTSWELACLGVPSVLIAVADNQLGNVRGLDQASAAIGIAEPSPAAIEAGILRLIESTTLRAELSSNARRLVDGRGAERVAELLRCEPVVLREPREEEAAAFPHPVDPPPDDRSRKLVQWVVQTVEQETIGVVTFVVQGGRAELRIDLLPGRRDPEIAESVVRRCCDRLFADSNVRRIESRSDSDGVDLARALSGAGFVRSRTDTYVLERS